MECLYVRLNVVNGKDRANIGNHKVSPRKLVRPVLYDVVGEFHAFSWISMVYKVLSPITGQLYKFNGTGLLGTILTMSIQRQMTCLNPQN